MHSDSARFGLESVMTNKSRREALKILGSSSPRSDVGHHVQAACEFAAQAATSSGIVLDKRQKHFPLIRVLHTHILSQPEKHLYGSHFRSSNHRKNARGCICNKYRMWCRCVTAFDQ